MTASSTETIARDDTVWVAGVRGRCVVESVNADGTFDVSRTWKVDYRTTRHTHYEGVHARRVTLIRKGNATDDAVAKLFAEMDRNAAEAAAIEAARVAEAAAKVAHDDAVVAARAARSNELAASGVDFLTALLTAIDEIPA